MAMYDSWVLISTLLPLKDLETFRLRMCVLLQCAVSSVSLLFSVMHAEPLLSLLLFGSSATNILFSSMLARGNSGHGSFLNSTCVCFSRPGGERTELPWEYHCQRIKKK